MRCRKRESQTGIGTNQFQTTNGGIDHGRTGTAGCILTVSQRTPCPLRGRIRETVDGTVNP